MIHAVIDPNVRIKGDRTYTGFEDLHLDGRDMVVPGDHVRAIEYESGASCVATVHEVDTARRIVVLEVPWAYFR
jgi:hypothetical protein